MKILTVIGARPQFVKAAALSMEINKHSDINEIIVHTGQHFDSNMSEVFFKELKIPKPNYNLNIHNLSHGAMTGRMLEEIEKILLSEKPNYLLVYGDTNSTLAASMAAKKLNIRIIHVEAGIRFYDFTMPEEINRILTDRVSDILFYTTDFAYECLKKEGFESFDCKLIKTGDIMVDAAMFFAQKPSKSPNIIERMGLINNKFILATVHRATNTDNINKLKTIMKTFNRINAEIPIFMPLHPRTEKLLQDNNIITEFITCPAIGYLEMLEVLKNCRLVITDSGGLQREAYVFEKNSVLLLDTTSWIELVENGFAIETQIDSEEIYNHYKKMIDANSDFSIQLYGDGNAAKEIVHHLKQDYAEFFAKKI